MIDFRTLVQAGVHFGHQKTRWCPKMAPYIWGFKNNVHLIDVSQTAIQLERASQFLKQVAADGRPILLVGTKKAAREIIFSIAQDLKVPYVNHRWIGGTLSNNSQVKKSVTKLLHYEDILAKADQFPHYTKKEFNVFQKMVDRLKKNVGGIRAMAWPLGAIVLVDVQKEHSALKEASIMGVPVVALVDTNSDPSLVNYVIPGNDDSPRAIKVVMDYLADAIRTGHSEADQRRNEKAAEEKAERERKAAAGLKEKAEKLAAEKAKLVVKVAPKPAVAAPAPKAAVSAPVAKVPVAKEAPKAAVKAAPKEEEKKKPASETNEVKKQKAE